MYILLVIRAPQITPWQPFSQTLSVWCRFRPLFSKRHELLQLLCSGDGRPAQKGSQQRSVSSVWLVPKFQAPNGRFCLHQCSVRSSGFCVCLSPCTDGVWPHPQLMPTTTPPKMRWYFQLAYSRLPFIIILGQSKSLPLLKPDLLCLFNILFRFSETHSCPVLYVRTCYIMTFFIWVRLWCFLEPWTSVV